MKRDWPIKEVIDKNGQIRRVRVHPDNKLEEKEFQENLKSSSTAVPEGDSSKASKQMF